MGSSVRCDDEGLLLLRETYYVERAFCIVRYSDGCEDQPCRWVRREGRQREKENIC
jgi:hypothetical protein